MIAVLQDGLSLKYASKTLRDDQDLVMMALKHGSCVKQEIDRNIEVTGVISKY